MVWGLTLTSSAEISRVGAVVGVDATGWSELFTTNGCGQTCSITIWVTLLSPDGVDGLNSVGMRRHRDGDCTAVQELDRALRRQRRRGRRGAGGGPSFGGPEARNAGPGGEEERGEDGREEPEAPQPHRRPMITVVKANTTATGDREAVEVLLGDGRSCGGRADRRPEHVREAAATTRVEQDQHDERERREDLDAHDDVG